MSSHLAALVLVFLPLAATNCSRLPRRSGEDYREVARYPHDVTASTQGLVLAGAALYEGTGEYGSSEVRRVDVVTGEVLARTALDSAVYGEGVTVLDGRLYQLTWTSGIVYIYDPLSLRRLDSAHVPGAGWGLTHDGTNLIVSDGSSELRFIEPSSWRTVRRLSVRRPDGAPVLRLNELEYVLGHVWANVYGSDSIVQVNVATGIADRWVNLASVYPIDQRDSSAGVLNGIAYNAATGTFYVSGKRWPFVVEVDLDSDAAGRE